MSLEWAAVLAAFGGGVFGASIGALPAFIFTGFAVLAGVGAAAGGGTAGVLEHFAFGPYLGPHTAFAGGAAAAAYARKAGLVENGRDITVGLMGLNRPDVLLVGGVFGAGGHLFNALLGALGAAAWTDTIACSVVASAIAARWMYGAKGLFGQPLPGAPQFRPSDAANWLRWQERPGQIAAIGLSVGAVSAYTGEMLTLAGGGAVAGFGLAAASLIFLQYGNRIPVTHHIALPAAAAALAGGGVLGGAVFGLIGAFLGEFFARLLLIHGDTHIDPPAAAIAASILLLRLVEAALP